jgi:hypothetical protein
MINFIIFIPHQILLGRYNQGGGACSTQESYEKCLQNCIRKLKGQIPMEDLYVDGRISLKLILNK